MTIWHQMDPTPSVMHSLGLAGFGTALIGVFGYLPIVVTVWAGVMAGISYTWTVWNSPEMKLWRARRLQRRQAKRITRLRAKQAVVQAKIAAYERRSEVKVFTETQVQAVKDHVKEQLKS